MKHLKITLFLTTFLTVYTTTPSFAADEERAQPAALKYHAYETRPDDTHVVSRTLYGGALNLVVFATNIEATRGKAESHEIKRHVEGQVFEWAKTLQEEVPIQESFIELYKQLYANVCDVQAILIHRSLHVAYYGASSRTACLFGANWHPRAQRSEKSCTCKKVIYQDELCPNIMVWECSPCSFSASFTHFVLVNRDLLGAIKRAPFDHVLFGELGGSPCEEFFGQEVENSAALIVSSYAPKNGAALVISIAEYFVNKWH